jgi:hypothetical protein
MKKCKQVSQKRPVKDLPVAVEVAPYGVDTLLSIRSLNLNPAKLIDSETKLCRLNVLEAMG